MYGWDDGFFDDDETPTLFDSIEEAEEDIQEHIEDVKDAIVKGYMDKDSVEERDCFRIVEVKIMKEDVIKDL
jgi:hypothetical protein